MNGTRGLAIVALAGFGFGTVMLVSWVARLAVARFPVVTGTVVARMPIQEWGVPRVDFIIEVPGAGGAPPAVVHAHDQRYLMDRVPAQVRFRYSGDPSRRVFLFEHEENPLWIWLVNWGAAAFLGAAAYRQRSPARAAARSAR